MKPMLAFLLISLPMSSLAGEEVSLFDGKSFAGWVDKKGEPVTGERGWVIDDGTMHRASKGGDIFTEKEFGDFVFSFEWKVAKGANSGVKYRFGRYGSKWLGQEFQVLDDDGHKNGKVAKTSAASLYDVMAPSGEKKLKPVGEWNTSKIVAKGNTFEHWLNGELVLRYDTSDEGYQDARKASKFKGVEDFGQSPRGKLMLQDHGDLVWFRNLVIEEFDTE